MCLGTNRSSQSMVKSPDSTPWMINLLQLTNLANLEVILHEPRDFLQENSETLREIKEKINKTNNMIDGA